MNSNFYRGCPEICIFIKYHRCFLGTVNFENHSCITNEFMERNCKAQCFGILHHHSCCSSYPELAVNFQYIYILTLFQTSLVSKLYPRSDKYIFYMLVFESDRLVDSYFFYSTKLGTQLTLSVSLTFCS